MLREESRSGVIRCLIVCTASGAIGVQPSSWPRTFLLCFYRRHSMHNFARLSGLFEALCCHFLQSLNLLCYVTDGRHTLQSASRSKSYRSNGRFVEALADPRNRASAVAAAVPVWRAKFLSASTSHMHVLRLQHLRFTCFVPTSYRG